MEQFSDAQCVSRLGEILAEQRAATLEGLTAALGEQLDRILEERFTQIAALVGAELEAVMRRARQAPATQAPPRAPEGWEALPIDEQRLHLRAQRFARVKAAEMLLYRAEAVARGRAQRDLYSEFASDIDAARQAFRQEFLTACPSMADYLHLELVRTLAHDEAACLGPGYPGPLV